MDHFDILKRAWNITWRYKALWVLGLFVGVGSSGGGGNAFSTDDGAAAGRLSRWIEANLGLVLFVAGWLVVIGFVFFVLSVAAQAGLIWGANEAAEGHSPSLREAWRIGFARWGRTFMTGLALWVPFFVLIAIMVIVIVGMVGGGAMLGDEAAGVGLVAGLCFVLPIFVGVLVVAAVIISIIYELALRYGVLDDVTFGRAIAAGWRDLRARRGAFVMWLVMLLPGMAFGVVALALAVPFMIPAIGLAAAERYGFVMALLGILFLVLLLPSAIYATFVSSAWTVFFRRMTGREVPAVAVAGASASAAPSHLPPPPVITEAPAPQEEGQPSDGA